MVLNSAFFLVTSSGYAKVCCFWSIVNTSDKLRIDICVLYCGGRLLHLSSEPLGDLGVRNVIYLVRASIENAQHIAQQIKETNRSAACACFEPVGCLRHHATRNTTLCSFGHYMERAVWPSGQGLELGWSTLSTSCRGGPLHANASYKRKGSMEISWLGNSLSGSYPLTTTCCPWSRGALSG